MGTGTMGTLVLGSIGVPIGYTVLGNKYKLNI